MINTSYNKRLYILSGITVAIVALAAVFVIYPYYSKITTLNKETYNKRVQLAIYEQQRTNIEQTQLDYNKIKNDIATIAKMFVSKATVPDLLTALEDVAARHTLTQDIAINQTATANTIPLTISLTGTWSNIVQYLADVQKLGYYASINNLSLTQNNSGLTATLSADTYTL